MAHELVTLRAARVDDMTLVNAYAYREGMGDMPGVEGITVAVNADDVPVGFIRVLPSPLHEGVAYVNPIVTYEPWRGYGVGRELMLDAEGSWDEMRLVARGESVPFYRALGYAEISWDDIEPEVNENCDECPLTEECHPLPMGKVLGR